MIEIVKFSFKYKDEVFLIFGFFLRKYLVAHYLIKYFIEEILYEKNIIYMRVRGLNLNRIIKYDKLKFNII